MSIVSKVFDSEGVPAAIISCAVGGDAANFGHNTNDALPSRAASERGTAEGLLGGAARLAWWRQGSDVHVLVSFAPTLASADDTATVPPMASVLRAVVRVPAGCVAVSCVPLPTPSPATAALFGVVGVSAQAEVLCARVAISAPSAAAEGGASSSFTLRVLPDVFTSLPLLGYGAVTAAAFAASETPAESLFSVLVAVGGSNGGLQLISVSDEGATRIAAMPTPVADGSAIAAIGAVARPYSHYVACLLEQSGDASAHAFASAPQYAVAYESGAVALVGVANGESAAYIEPHHGRALAIAGAALAADGCVALAVSADSGDTVALSLLRSGSSAAYAVTAQHIIAQPTEAAFVGSLFVSGAGAAVVGYLGAEMWTVPTTVVSAFRRHPAHVSSVVCRVDLRASAAVDSPQQQQQQLWLVADDTTEPFWFCYADDDAGATLMATADAATGEVALYAAESPTTLLASAATAVFGHYAPEEAVNTQHSPDAPSVFTLTVAPLGAAAEEAGRAALLQQKAEV